MGTVTGMTERFSHGGSNQTVEKFLGIPYAQPPVGNLRLQRPVAIVSNGHKPYNATFYRPICIQASSSETDNSESEDCLYLNVFVPETEADRTIGHAVMIWVYGGSFTSGSANLYDGTALAAVGNVIVVTFNYRVGFFGFYSTGDSSAPGNYGLYDQAQAFQWVHENIEAFGGDKSRVTIFGESAGSMSVNFHATYPKNTGRFQRVIGQSGVVTTPYLNTARNVAEHSMLLGKNMNCSTKQPNKIVECLRKSAWKYIKNTLLKMEATFPGWQVSFFVPIADGDIIMLPDKKWYEDPKRITFFKSLDLITGRNMYDGGETLIRLVPDVDMMSLTRENMRRLIDVPTFIDVTGAMSESVRRAILHEYTDWNNPDSHKLIRLQFVNLLTEFFYGAPAAKTLQLHADGNMTRYTYAYMFTPVTTSRMPWTPSWLPGADHAEEVRSVFGLYFLHMAKWEQVLSLQIMTYWSNFAKSG